MPFTEAFLPKDICSLAVLFCLPAMTAGTVVTSRSFACLRSTSS